MTNAGPELVDTMFVFIELLSELVQETILGFRELKRTSKRSDLSNILEVVLSVYFRTE